MKLLSNRPHTLVIVVLAALLMAGPLLGLAMGARPNEAASLASPEQLLAEWQFSEATTPAELPPYVVPSPDAPVEHPDGVRFQEPGIPNFGWAVEGVLARSGQPSPEGFRILRDKYNVGGIVNLRQNNDEATVVRRLGMAYFNIPVTDDRAPSPLHVRYFFQFMRAMTAQGKAVLVHCKAGVGRTGTMVALYRMEQGHTTEHALQESIDWGMSLSTQHSGREQVAALNDYATKLGLRKWFPPNFQGGRVSPYSYTPISQEE